MTSHYPTIILGGGTFGTAAAWRLCQRGERALVLEQFQHVHTMGAHGGQTRVIRHAYAEDAGYIPHVLRADQLWCELQEELQTTLLHRVGSVEMDAPGYSHAARARQSAIEAGLPYEWLDGAEVRRRWPSLLDPDDWVAGFDPDAGFLEVEPALHGMAALARDRGVEIRENSPALKWGASDQGAWVETTEQRYTSDRLIIAAGGWAGPVLADLGLPLTVVRKVLYWLEVENPALFQPDRFPVFITDSRDGEIYGFPIHGQPGLKIARHDGGLETTADTVDRTVAPAEAMEVLPLAQRLFPGVTGNVVSSAVCHYARTPDTHFIIDRHPSWPNVIIAAGFSGHGFKFAPAVGEMLVNLALDPAAEPEPLFALGRFGSPAPSF